MMHQQTKLDITRRHFFAKSATGIGTAALASLLNPHLLSAANAPTGFLRFAPRAKRIISLFMSGGPSHVDLFDPKPLLTKRDGQPIPKSIIKDHKFAMIKESNPKIKGSPWKFAKHGNSGLDVSELLPHTAKVADDLCLIRSVHPAGGADFWRPPGAAPADRRSGRRDAFAMDCLLAQNPRQSAGSPGDYDRSALDSRAPLRRMECRVKRSARARSSVG